MTNLLEETINSNDANHAAKVIQEALGIESDDVANYVLRRRGRATVSSALGPSRNGCRPKPVFLPDTACPCILVGCHSSDRACLSFPSNLACPVSPKHRRRGLTGYTRSITTGFGSWRGATVRRSD